MTFAQLGGQTSVTTGLTAYYSDGVHATVCNTSTGTPICTANAKPLNGQLSLIEPTQMLAALSQLDTKTLTHSTKSNGDKCLTFTNSSSNQVNVCVNSAGIVTSLTIPQGSVHLTSYATVVSPSDVSVPAGATFESASSVP
jgi:hypothetical protein